MGIAAHDVDGDGYPVYFLTGDAVRAGAQGRAGSRFVSMVNGDSFDAHQTTRLWALRALVSR
jgi:hypothetical protein